MARPLPDRDTSAGQDSFLDVVTNIVGILIILVMVIGARIRQVALQEPAPAVAGDLGRELHDLQATVASAEHEIDELQAQATEVHQAAALAGEVRLQLATLVAAARVDVQQRREAAASARVAAAEAAARRATLEEEVRRCEADLAGVGHEPATTTEVLAYPTPIGRTVNGEELHFRLAEGRIAYLPLEELFELAKGHTRRHSGSLAQLSARIETVGPEQGFALDYVIEAKIDQARGQVLVRSREWVVKPVEPGLGEPVAVALGSSSRFRGVLARARPDTTITLWCYPDSFAAYRDVRAELHRLGLASAGRPLPEGAPIGGSADGSKSVVQ